MQTSHAPSCADHLNVRAGEFVILPGDREQLTFKLSFSGLTSLELQVAAFDAAGELQAWTGQRPMLKDKMTAVLSEYGPESPLCYFVWVHSHSTHPFVKAKSCDITVTTAPDGRILAKWHPPIHLEKYASPPKGYVLWSSDPTKRDFLGLAIVGNVLFPLETPMRNLDSWTPKAPLNEFAKTIVPLRGQGAFLDGLILKPISVTHLDGLQKLRSASLYLRVAMRFMSDPIGAYPAFSRAVPISEGKVTWTDEWIRFGTLPGVLEDSRRELTFALCVAGRKGPSHKDKNLGDATLIVDLRELPLATQVVLLWEQRLNIEIFPWS